MENMFRRILPDAGETADRLTAFNSALSGLVKCQTDFLIPYYASCAGFVRTEWFEPRPESAGIKWTEYGDLLNMNLALWGRVLSDSLRTWEIVAADPAAFCPRLVSGMTRAGVTLPAMARDIRPDAGFHFDDQSGDPSHTMIAETDRFYLYQIHSPVKAAEETVKPVLILPPLLPGSDILNLLPAENRSYVRAFADPGIPTYIRIMKDITATPACQTMTLADAAADTRIFCEKLAAVHGKKVTLNGVGQGGYEAVCQILSDGLDDTVDALITCHTVMDGTRGRGLGDILGQVPARFRQSVYAGKVLTNGNRVADGEVMAWLSRLRNGECQTPITALFRQMALDSEGEISRPEAALHAILTWPDMPMAFAEMSMAVHTESVTAEGTLPVRLADRELNLTKIGEKNISWLLCYDDTDDPMEQAAVLVPADHAPVEMVPFPGNLVAMAAEYAHPDSDVALNRQFGPDNRYRGPVRFHLDLNESMDEALANAAKEKDAPAADAPVLEEKPATAAKADTSESDTQKIGSAKIPAKPSAKTTTTRKPAVRKTKAKKAAPAKPAAKKTAAKKTAAPKSTARKAPAKKTTAKKAPAKKATTKSKAAGKASPDKGATAKAGAAK